MKHIKIKVNIRDSKEALITILPKIFMVENLKKIQKKKDINKTMIIIILGNIPEKIVSIKIINIGIPTKDLLQGNFKNKKFLLIDNLIIEKVMINIMSVNNMMIEEIMIEGTMIEEMIMEEMMIEEMTIEEMMIEEMMIEETIIKEMITKRRFIKESMINHIFRKVIMRGDSRNSLMIIVEIIDNSMMKEEFNQTFLKPKAKFRIKILEKKMNKCLEIANKNISMKKITIWKMKII